MKRTALLILALCACAGAAQADDRIVDAALARTQSDVRYDPAYVRIDYPGGDVPADTGVCTDVIIRTYRAAFGFDFQRAVHEDMTANFSDYPKTWGLSRPDPNIDHRRVPNLETFLTRQGAFKPLTHKPADYRPGDIVTFRLDGRLPHIGIVSSTTSRSGTPLIIHNIGAGVVEDDLLYKIKTHRHFRFVPETGES